MAGVILAVIAVAEGWWLLVNANHRLDRFLHYTGFRGKSASPWGWVAAVVCTVCSSSVRTRESPEIAMVCSRSPA